MRDETAASRRSLLRTGLGLAIGVAGGAFATVAHADDGEDSKVEKSVVQYQYKWNADGSHCAICANFLAPASCKVVAGKIDPNGYCIAFAPKDGK